MSTLADQVKGQVRARAWPCRRAFTLIELLVVVAVIGILASLVMPALVHSMRSASTAKCQSNLHQMHGGLMHYANDFGEFIVPLGNYPHMDPFFRGWHFTLKPYLKDMGILTCPARPLPVGIGMNYRVVGGVSESLSLFRYPQSLTLIRKPSQSFIFCDWGYVLNPDDHPDDWKIGKSPHTNQVNSERSYARMPIDVLRPGSKRYYTSYETDPHRPVPSHPGYKTNCVFFDAHVQAFPTWDIVDDDPHPARASCGGATKPRVPLRASLPIRSQQCWIGKGCLSRGTETSRLQSEDSPGSVNRPSRRCRRRASRWPRSSRSRRPARSRRRPRG